MWVWKLENTINSWDSHYEGVFNMAMEHGIL